MPTGIGSGIAGQVFTEPHTPAGPACKTTYSCLFDGVAESLIYAAGKPLLGAGGTGNFTITWWMKSPNPASGANQRILTAQAGSTVWALYLSATGSLTWISTGTGFWNDGSGYTLAADTWVHYAYSVDRSGNATFYENAANPNAKSIAANTITFDSAGTFYVGRQAGGQYFDGKMTEIAIWQQALSQVEIAQLYNNTAGECYNDVSAFSFAGSLQNWWRCWNPSGTYVNPMPDLGTIAPTINLTPDNMDATNVSTDTPL